jgi:hypothetical protein
MDQPSPSDSITITINIAPAPSSGPILCVIGKAPLINSPSGGKSINSPSGGKLGSAMMRCLLKSFQRLCQDKG